MAVDVKTLAFPIGMVVSIVTIAAVGGIWIGSMETKMESLEETLKQKAQVEFVNGISSSNREQWRHITENKTDIAKTQGAVGSVQALLDNLSASHTDFKNVTRSQLNLILEKLTPRPNGS